MIVIAIEFRKLQTVKDLVNPLSRKRRFRTSFDSQHVNGWQNIVKSAREYFDHIFWSLLTKITSKTSPFWKFEIIEVFVNKLTADGKYPVGDCENLQFLNHIKLAYKRKTFSQSFVPFMGFPSIFKHFGKKDDRDSWCIFEITDFQRLG